MGIEFLGDIDTIAPKEKKGKHNIIFIKRNQRDEIQILADEQFFKRFLGRNSLEPVYGDKTTGVDR